MNKTPAEKFAVDTNSEEFTATFTEMRERGELATRREHLTAARTARSEAADEIEADADLRDAEGEHDLAEYGRELARLIRTADDSPKPESTKKGQA